MAASTGTSLVGASARAQLTAGYTVNTYSKPPLYYTLARIILSALWRLSWRAYAGLAALCRM